MTDESESKAPSDIPWPPILLAGGALFGFLMQEALPIAVPGDYRIIGAVLLGAALLLDAWVFELFRRHNTNIRPDRPAKALVTHGPFRYSRNPIYVGNVMILLGLLLLTGSLWFLISAIAFVPLVEKLAIRKEEAHLAEEFGDAWEQYAQSTRRWI